MYVVPTAIHRLRSFDMAQLPANISIRPGQYARFNALGGFLRVEDYCSNGLGFVYRARQDGSLRRVFGL